MCELNTSVGRATAAPRGRRTGGQTGRGGGRTRGRSSDQGNGGIDGQGGQVGGQGNEVNDGVDGVPDFSTIIAQQLQNLLPTILAQVGNQGIRQGNDVDEWAVCFFISSLRLVVSHGVCLLIHVA
ncbi:hypothetical protein Tco_1277934 [Tanacetum coccineum]